MDTGTQGTEGQGATATQPSPTAPVTPSAAELVEKARLDGAMLKIQELTLANRALADDVTAKTKSLGSLQADLTQKESIWNAQQTEFTTKLTSAEAEKALLASKLVAADALKLKMKIIDELKAPALYGVLDVVPDTTDEAALRASLTKLAAFAGNISQSREKELMAGITKVDPVQQNVELPTTDEGWKNYVATLEFGTPAYNDAMAQWHGSLFKS